jgi:hypothetical protein
MESADELLSRTLFHLDKRGDHKRYSDFYNMVATLEEYDQADPQGSDRGEPKAPAKFILGHWYLKPDLKPSLDELQKYPKEKVQRFFTQHYQIPAMIVATTDHLVSGPQHLIDEVNTQWLEGKIIFNNDTEVYQIFKNKKWEDLKYWDSVRQQNWFATPQSLEGL